VAAKVYAFVPAVIETGQCSEVERCRSGGNALICVSWRFLRMAFLLLNPGNWKHSGVMDHQVILIN
jgi:hypothetical protein